MAAFGIQIIVLLVIIGLPLVLAFWLVRTLSALTRAVRGIDDKLASIQRTLADASIAAPPNER